MSQGPSPALLRLHEQIVRLLKALCAAYDDWIKAKKVDPLA